MKKATKIWLLIATALVVVGCIILVTLFFITKGDGFQMASNPYVTREYPISESFHSISIKADTADITLAPTDSPVASVICYEQDTLQHAVSVRDGTLVIEAQDGRKWYDFLRFNLKKPKITVYIPQTECTSLVIASHTGDIEIKENLLLESMDITLSTGNVTVLADVSGPVKITTSTGDIRVEGISADSMDLTVTTGQVGVTDVHCTKDISLKVSTGEACLTNIRCKKLTSNGSTGDIALKNVIADETFDIRRSTGDITFDRCDAYEINVETDTGNVTGSLLSGKIFITDSDTGRIRVPQSTTGGKCTITTDTGDIKITIQ